MASQFTGSHPLHLIFGVRGGNAVLKSDVATTATATFTQETLGRKWQQLNYTLDVCQEINGAHIEIMRTKTKTLHCCL